MDFAPLKVTSTVHSKLDEARNQQVEPIELTSVAASSNLEQSVTRESSWPNQSPSPYEGTHRRNRVNDIISSSDVMGRSVVGRSRPPKLAKQAESMNRE